MLSVSAVMMGKEEIIHPTLIWDDNDMVLIDTAYPGQSPLISAEIASLGLSIDKLTKIIITHQDLDHIGCLPNILSSCTEVEVFASSIEKPYIQGEKMLVKLTPEAIAEAVRSLPEEVPVEWKNAFRHMLEHPPKAAVNTTIEHGEQLPLCGGLEVILTPGHTPGHVSLYHHPSKTLIAADALIVKENELLGPDPRYCSDYELAKQSLKQLLNYNIQQIFCFHGGRYEGDCNERIAEIAQG